MRLGRIAGAVGALAVAPFFAIVAIYMANVGSTSTLILVVLGILCVVAAGIILLGPLAWATRLAWAFGITCLVLAPVAAASYVPDGIWWGAAGALTIAGAMVLTRQTPPTP